MSSLSARTRRLIVRCAPVALGAVLLACVARPADRAAPVPETTAVAIPTASPISPAAAPAVAARVLPPLAHTIAQRVLLAPLVGVDDLAARAWTPRGGGTVILKLSEGPRLERLASGFAWER